MITKYFTSVVVRFSPFSKEAKNARLFLSAIPPIQRASSTKLSTELMTDSSTKPSLIKVTFKDKTIMEVDPGSMSFKEISSFFDRHSRKLQLKDSIESR
ncbi:mitochondrial 54S ribosomal protein mL53 Ecym_6255 [Eremothecium cymbalariae DBVPG|uniref:Large ribosomal subunit protein mL53 n=1 Tax=Eremothecium cymbalariae (strain CBS 270.75 / DBVPG 7215 / KCTC 17166 / NRRL Y-17582) TaxID=931890 RepID=G8JVF8_ERECY|nr:hypothetical protein Ecym_6255 [Eremothecium cymbalariae DBVPG\